MTTPKLCPRCSSVIPYGMSNCPRCGWSTAKLEPPPEPPLRTLVRPSFGPGTPGGLSLTDPLTARQDARLDRVRPPDVTELGAVATHGRYRPLRLSGALAGSLDPRNSYGFRFRQISPATLAAALEWILEPYGFALAWPPARPGPFEVGAGVRPSFIDGDTEVYGWVFLERNVRVALTETRRMDRLRWLGFGVSSAIGVPSLGLALAIERLPFLYLAFPGAGAFAAMVVTAMSFVNANYWSDVVAAKFRGRTYARVAPTEGSSAILDLDVQLWAVRALTQDWESKYGSGRDVKAGIPSATMQGVLRSVHAGLTIPPPPPLIAINSDPSALSS